ncbi:MAG: methyl-accepting chemotaxis protein [Granulosicoccus sp.]
MSLGTILVTVISGISSQRENAALIDAAGRQRMLNQRFIKEILIEADQPGKAGEPALSNKTKALFTNTLNTLTNGGTLIVNPAAGIKIEIDGATDSNLLAILKKNEQLRIQLHAAGQNYIDSKISGSNDVPVERLQDLGTQLHTQANAAVKAYVAQSNIIINSLIKRCILISIIAGIISTIATILIIRNITQPISQCSEALKRASTGNLTLLPDIKRSDEFGRIVKDLNTTLEAVSNAVGSDHVDWHDIGTVLTDLRADLQGTRAIVTQAPAPMLMVDTYGKVTYINPSAEKQIEQLVANNAFLHPLRVGDKLTKASQCMQHLESRTIDHTQLPYSVVVDFGTEQLSIDANALTDDNSKPMGSLISWNRVTEQIKRKAKLKAIEKLEKEKNTELTTLIQQLNIVLEAASKGNLNHTVPTGNEDEFNKIAKSVNELLGYLRRDFQKIYTNSIDLANAANMLSKSSHELNTHALATRENSLTVSHENEGVSEFMTTAASATEQMSASIKEISGNTESANDVASEAIDIANRATNTVQALFKSSTDIGNVLKFINSIAEQTNLLALNATIEAARAGDAGKGFAVVANEVKDLAKQTANATVEIAERIGSIQTDSSSAVSSIDEINNIIAKIAGFQTTIAAALEQQTTVSRELSQTVLRTADSGVKMHERITELLDSSVNSMQSVEDTKAATDNIVDHSQSLVQLLNNYSFREDKTQSLG